MLGISSRLRLSYPNTISSVKQLLAFIILRDTFTRKDLDLIEFRKEHYKKGVEKSTEKKASDGCMVCII